MRAIAATIRAGFIEAWSNRSGFWTQVLTMVFNDLAWVAFWVLFFHRVGRLQGWDTHRVLLLLAVLTTSAGFVLGVLSNARAIGRMAADGELDAALVLPVAPLAYLLVRRITTTNLGDVFFGVALFIFAGHPTPERTAIYLFGSLTASIIFTGFLVMIGSLSFFAGRNDTAELGFHTMLMFANYPVDVFGGPAKLFLYTVLPAALVSTVPAKLIDQFDPSVAIGAVVAAAVFGIGGWVTFSLGLRRYSSGAVWTKA